MDNKEFLDWAIFHHNGSIFSDKPKAIIANALTDTVNLLAEEDIEIENSAFTVHTDTAFLKFFAEIDGEEREFYIHICTFDDAWEDQHIEDLNAHSDKKSDLESEESSGRLEQAKKSEAYCQLMMMLSEPCYLDVYERT